MTIFLNLIGMLIVIPLMIALVIGVYWLLAALIFEVILGLPFSDWCAGLAIKAQDAIEKRRRRRV